MKLWRSRARETKKVKGYGRREEGKKISMKKIRDLRRE